MTVFNSGLSIHDKLSIVISEEICDICDTIQDHYKGLEFSILCKGEWSPKGFNIDRNDWVAPIQTIGGASVDYDAENLLQLKQSGYNTIIHSHPMNMKEFSGSDMETICTQFPASILYNDGDFTSATMAIPVSPGHVFRAKVEVVLIHYSKTEVELDKLKNISKHHYTPAKKVTDYKSPLNGIYTKNGKNSLYDYPKYPFSQYTETGRQMEDATKQSTLPNILDVAVSTDIILAQLREDVTRVMADSICEPEVAGADPLLVDTYFRQSDGDNGRLCDGSGMFVRGRYIPINGGRGSTSSDSTRYLGLTQEEARKLAEVSRDRHKENKAALSKWGAIP